MYSIYFQELKQLIIVNYCKTQKAHANKHLEDDMSSENYEKIFNEHYKDALSLNSDNAYQKIALNRLLENHLLRKNWITLSKNESSFSKNKPILYKNNISILRLQLEQACPKRENDLVPSIIDSTFPKKAGIQLLLRYSLYAYDEAIYHFHHSVIQASSPIEGLSELQDTVKFAKKIENLLSNPSVEQLSRSIAFRAFSHTLPKFNSHEEQSFDFDELKKFFSTYAHSTDEIIKIFKQSVGQLPTPMPLSGSKKNYPARGRDYFIKILSPVMINLFDKANDRIIAEITNAIFNIYSTDENTVTKIRLNAQ